MARARSQAAEARGAHAKERGQFHQLLLKNPNYFGNFPESGLKPILELAGNIFYEQLTCVAYNFSRDELEATVQIKRATGTAATSVPRARGVRPLLRRLRLGLGGCGPRLVQRPRHPELDRLRGAHDEAAHVRRHLPARAAAATGAGSRCCRMCARSSPGARFRRRASPNWVQPWGNTFDRHVQIRPRPLIVHDIAVAVAATLGQQLKLPPEFEYLKLEKIPLPPEPPDPPIEQLAELYLKSAKAAKTPLVEPHRFCAARAEGGRRARARQPAGPLREVRTA